MKKFLLIAVAAVMALGFASCTKDNVHKNGGETVKMSVRINGGAGVKVTRAVEAPAVNTAGTIIANQLPGRIFVYETDGTFFGSYAVTSSAFVAPGSNEDAGQVIAPAPQNAKVYVVLNIPTADVATLEAAAATGLADLKAASSSIATQADYTQVALANVNATEVSAVDADNNMQAQAAVSVAPLVARIELVKTTCPSTPTANTDPTNPNIRIAAYEVHGVYMTNFHKDFTYAGGGLNQEPWIAGSALEESNTVYSDYNMATDGNWAATAVSGTLVASPADADPTVAEVWAFNVAAGSFPTMAVKLSGVTAFAGATGAIAVDVSAGGTVISSSNVPTTDFFLTIGGFTDGGVAVPSLVPGNVYRMNDLPFTVNNLFDSANPGDVALYVPVEIVEWNIVVVEPVLQ